MGTLWWSSIASAGTFMPPAATEIASEVDQIYAFMLVASLISLILLIGGMCWFVYKYKRRTANDSTPYITHNHTLEFIWSFVPFVIFMFVFAWGWHVFHQMRSFPENALEVHVVGKKWAWRFLYKNGKEVLDTVDAKGDKQPATMVVPVGRAVKLIMSSEKINAASTDPTDKPVSHDFYIPAFRIKQDVVAGRYTSEWFKADKEGEYWVFCTQYCGTNHWGMRAKVKVVSNEEFEKWLGSDGDAAGGSLADRGRALYVAKACVGCHSLDGTRVVGPSFKGLYNSMQEIEGMAPVKADDDYIRESILYPSAKITKGYPDHVMPVFAGQLADDDIKSLIEFIKTVK